MMKARQSGLDVSATISTVMGFVSNSSGLVDRDGNAVSGEDSSFLSSGCHL